MGDSADKLISESARRKGSLLQILQVDEREWESKNDLVLSKGEKKLIGVDGGYCGIWSARASEKT